MTTVNIKLLPQKNGLLAGEQNRTNVLAKIAVDADDLTMSNQVPINLAIVIDRSGSMNGERLMEAKKCAMKIVESLRAIDSVSVIAFDSVVEVVCPIQKVKNKELIVSDISGIEARGMTNLHGGWLAGVEQLVEVHQEGHLSRVMVLSDGHANEGELDIDQISTQCRKMADTGITTSTYGVGEDFSEMFLSAMAEAGAGNAYYGELASDLEDAFMEEFSLLQNIYASDVVLTVKPKAGVSVKVKNNYSKLSRYSYQLPNLAMGAECWVLFEVNKICDTTMMDAELLMAIEVQYTVLNDGASQDLSTSLSVPVLNATNYALLVEDEEVTQRALELSIADLNMKARELAKKGKWEAIEDLIEEHSALVANNPWVASKLRELKRLAMRKNREQFSKEAYYSSMKMNRRLKSSEENTACYSMDLELAAPAFLRRKAAQGKRVNPLDEEIF